MKGLDANVLIRYQAFAVGFADCLIAELSKAQGVAPIMTFDVKASTLDGFELLQ